MLKAATKSFSEIAEKTRLAFENVEVEQEEDLAAHLPEDYYRSLEERCREWTRAQERDSRWVGLHEYEAACEQRGYDVSGFWGRGGGEDRPIPSFSLRLYQVFSFLRIIRHAP
jgi:hypothetical protein